MFFLVVLIAASPRDGWVQGVMARWDGWAQSVKAHWDG
jgi:hypothetical protein